MLAVTRHYYLIRLWKVVEDKKQKLIYTYKIKVAEPGQKWLRFPCFIFKFLLF